MNLGFADTIKVRKTLHLCFVSNRKKSSNFFKHISFWSLKMVVRSYEEECQFIEKLTPYSYRIKKGFQPNMNVEGIFYVNQVLRNVPSPAF